MGMAAPAGVGASLLLGCCFGFQIALLKIMQIFISLYIKISETCSIFTTDAKNCKASYVLATSVG